MWIESADSDMAVNIIYNAKTQRIGVCNACESIVIHRKDRGCLYAGACGAFERKAC